MKKLLIALTLLLLGVSAQAIFSTTNSAVFTLDTKAPTLALISPNGGEEWYLGDTNNILWNATDNNLANNSVYIWYSLNGGTDYTSLAQEIANSGSFAWPTPEQLSNSGKVKIQVADSFGNISQKVSASAFSITHVPPAYPEGVTLAINSSGDIEINWQPVTETIHGTPIIPDGYLVLYNETAYENVNNYYYYLWDVTEGYTFTHHHVALHRDQMYYRVVAYKDYDGRLADILSELKSNPELKLSFAEIKTRLQSVIGDVK